jgi:uncharacterized peroxidase-related enzyme
VPGPDSDGPWIRTIAWEDAEGLLKEAYDWQAERLGEPTEFTMLGSLYPEVVMERLKLYRVAEGCPSSLPQQERQLAAYVTSLLNGTTHCASGLRVKLASLDVDPAVQQAVEANPRQPSTGSERLDAICSYAAIVTAAPATVSQADVERLRAVGLDDLDIVDLNNLVAYYNYINRVANGLGQRNDIPSEHALRAMPK